MRVGRKPASRGGDGAVTSAPARRRRGVDGPSAQVAVAEAPARPARQRAANRARRPQEPRGQRPGPQTAPIARPVDRPARPKTASQAKARAKARKAKAPKAIRLPLRERLIARIPAVDLRPRTLMAKVPFVVLVIGSLAVGLASTLWLSTDAAERSYKLGSARAVNDALLQQKEALERNVLEAESAPALADAARNLGMIPSRDAAHLVQDPAGNWIVIGNPKPAEGAPPPPLNSKLPDELPPAPAPPPAPKPGTRAEVPTRPVPARPDGGRPGSTEVPVVLPPPPNPFSADAPAGSAQPGPAPQPGPGGLVLLPVAPQAVDVPPGDPIPAPGPVVPAAPVAGPVAGAAPGAPQ